MNKQEIKQYYTQKVNNYAKDISQRYVYKKSEKFEKYKRKWQKNILIEIIVSIILCTGIIILNNMQKEGNVPVYLQEVDTFEKMASNIPIEQLSDLLGNINTYSMFFIIIIILITTIIIKRPPLIILASIIGVFNTLQTIGSKEITFMSMLIGLIVQLAISLMISFNAIWMGPFSALFMGVDLDSPTILGLITSGSEIKLFEIFQIIIDNMYYTINMFKEIDVQGEWIIKIILWISLITFNINVIYLCFIKPIKFRIKNKNLEKKTKNIKNKLIRSYRKKIEPQIDIQIDKIADYSRRLSKIAKDINQPLAEIKRFDNDKGYYYNGNELEIREQKVMYLTPTQKENILKKQLNELESIMKKLNIEKFRDGNFRDINLKKVDYKVVEKYFKGEDTYCTKNNNLKIIKYLNLRYNMLKNMYKNTVKGRLGEELVNNTIRDFDNCITLDSRRLEVEDNSGKIQSIEMDAIIISTRGLFVLEVKNYASEGQYEIIINKDGRWSAKYSDKTVEMSNANEQNNRHIMYLNKYINNKLNLRDEEYIHANGVTVISNNKVNIKNESDLQVVLRPSDIYNYINSYPVIWKYDKVKQIADVIEEGNCTQEKKFKVIDIHHELKHNLHQFELYLINRKKLEKEYNDIIDEFCNNELDILKEIDNKIEQLAN